MKNLIQTALVTLFAASAAHAQQAVQWKVSDGGNGHWYQLITPPDRINVGDAATAAIQRGGDLASVGSTAENQFVFVLAAATPSMWTLVWTGATQISGPWIGAHYVDGAWQWSDRNTWNFANWSPGNPNYLPGESAVLYMGEANGPPTNMWNNMYPYYLNWGYVIEWSADCNSDGIVDYGQCHDGTLPDYNGNNIPDCCERGEACVAGNYPLQWQTEDGGNGHWYQLKSAPLQSWSNCVTQADAVGGHLVTLTSPQENEFVVTGLAGSATRYPWIGLSQSPDANEPSGGWTWITGEPLAWSNWSPSEPNGDGSFDADQANLWMIGDVDQGRPRGKWNDWHTGGPDGYIVEWDADCNNDGLVDYGQILQGQLGDTNADGIPDICQQPTCVDADIYRDFNVNGADLGILLSQWGPNTPLTESDLNNDGIVNGADLGIMLSFWGACP